VGARILYYWLGVLGRGVEVFWTPLRLILRKFYIVFRVSWLRYLRLCALPASWH
jgi:hypothetical protein